MITHLYVNGVQIDNSNTFLARLKDVGSAKVDVASYNRGGVSGQMLAKPLKRGYTLGLELTVIGDSAANFITQKDRLVKYFQNSLSDSSYFQTLGFELSDGTVKELPVVFSQLVSGISPENILHQQFSVNAYSEREYFTSRTAKSETVTIKDLGGFGIPFAVPFDMSASPSQIISTLTNSGNVSGFPVITVYGGFASGFSILNDTHSLQFDYTDDIPVGESVVIDMYNRTAIKNGVTNVLSYLDGDWVYLGAGDNVLRITGAGGDTGYMSVAYYDYYSNL